MTKELTPSYHKKLIQEGKMTPEESQRIINDWKFQQATKAQMKVIENSLEEREAEGIERWEQTMEDEAVEDMGLEEEVEEAEFEAEQAERSDRDDYTDSRGVKVG